ncbi:MAG TPA: ribosomal protein S18-alanine N-acetyltransferase [Caulobacteraceae bacterium]|jgi:ribosomal-protein-alanine N-acetyltransferase
MRRAIRADAEALARAHAAAFDGGWSADDIAALLQAAGALALLTEDDGEASGFILGRSVADEAEILTIAVAPAARRQGLGRALVEGLARQARLAGAAALFLEVAEDNGAARALYQGCGFVLAGRRRAYYGRPGGRADALVLRRTLNSGGA